MIRLRVLGSVELTDARGVELTAILAQPKRLSLLAYLAISPEFHRRDKLLALFWPELDTRKARGSLNQSIGFLRKELGGSPGSVIVSRGNGELGIDSSALWCDVSTFRDYAHARRYPEALDLYRGDLLPGLHAVESNDFHDWLDDSRAQLRVIAVHSAREVAQASERERHFTTAVTSARRAVELSGLDERAVRELLGLLDRLGDRAGAVNAYDEFARRLSTELEAAPSPETAALVAQIRNRTLVSERPQAQPERDPGAQLNGWRVIRELGAGGMATVHLALDVKHNRHVAIKELRPELSSWVETTRFLREIQITASFAHPHILPLIDSGLRNGVPYLVTPYVAGESLRARLAREGRLAPDEAVRLTMETAKALDYAHRQGIIHCDIKPENILLADGHAVVADFGIARAVAASDSREAVTKESEAVLGSPPYMSPELLDRGVVGPRTDVYALGCVLVEMLTGSPPERGVDSSILLQGLSPEIAQLTGECLAVDPQDRLQSAAELIRRLEILMWPTAFQQGDVPSVTNLSKRLRSELPPVSRSAAGPPALVIDQKSPAPAPSNAPEESAGARSARRFSLPRRAAAITMAIPAIVGIVLAESGFPGRRSSTQGTNAESHASGTTTAIAILPFQITGSDTTLQLLKEGLNDLLAAKLSGVTGLTIIDPQAGVRALQRSSGNASGSMLADAMDAGRRLGAQQVITGTIAAAKGRVQLTARLTNVRSAGILADVAVTAPADSLMSLLDQLAAEVLTLAAGESPSRMMSLAQSPLPSVKAYLSGQMAYRQGQYDQASDRFKEALQFDSRLALAALRLAFASGAAGRPSAEHDSAIARAWAARDRLIPRDLAFLKAFATGAIPQLHTNLREVYQRWEDAITEVPDWPEVWNAYGDFFFHQDSGRATRAAAAFRRALELDSMFLPAIPHALQLAAVAGDTSSVRRLAARYLSRDPASGDADYIRWRTALALDDSVTIRRVRATFSTMRRETLRWIIQAADFDGVGTSDARAAAQALVGRAGSTEELIEGYQFSHDVALNAGRPDDALAALAGIGGATPATYDADRWRVLDALYSIGDSTAAHLADARIASSAEGPSETTSYDRAMQYRNMCVHAQWRLSRGDLPAVRRMIARLPDGDNPDGVLPQWAHGEVPVCKALLRAMLSAVVAPTTLRRNLAALDSVIDAGSPGEALGYFPIARSRLYAQCGDTAAALAAVRTRIYFAFNAPYIATQLRDEARYAEIVGDTVGVVRALRHYLSLRHGSVGQANVEVAEVQAILARLDRR